MTSYEGLDDDEELKMVSVINQNDNNNMVSDSKSGDGEKTFLTPQDHYQCKSGKCNEKFVNFI